ncbi:hypothetical protein FA95DRAFT_222038 [Auriscalpium vulgare]|uniref:Uncharacterized protein n=1 Tax=Auriscalpium vulgare TaxID=40419 RepID=A0ACB8RMP4_9AGAM|nr:hypothetical protein FA95DRAFT_222038 [Auriscalpium vulgare]
MSYPLCSDKLTPAGWLSIRVAFIISSSTSCCALRIRSTSGCALRIHLNNSSVPHRPSYALRIVPICHVDGSTHARKVALISPRRSGSELGAVGDVLVVTEHAGLHRLLERSRRWTASSRTDNNRASASEPPTTHARVFGSPSLRAPIESVCGLPLVVMSVIAFCAGGVLPPPSNDISTQPFPLVSVDA